MLFCIPRFLIGALLFWEKDVFLLSLLLRYFLFKVLVGILWDLLSRTKAPSHFVIRTVFQMWFSFNFRFMAIDRSKTLSNERFQYSWQKVLENITGGWGNHEWKYWISLEATSDKFNKFTRYYLNHKWYFSILFANYLGITFRNWRYEPNNIKNDTLKLLVNTFKPSFKSIGQYF